MMRELGVTRFSTGDLVIELGTPPPVPLSAFGMAEPIRGGNRAAQAAYEEALEYAATEGFPEPPEGTS